MKARILYVEGNVDGTVGGSYFSLLYLVEGVARRGADVHVVFHHDHALRARFEATGATVHILPPDEPIHLAALHSSAAKRFAPLRAGLQVLQRARNAFQLMRTLRDRVRFLKTHRFDLVHLNNSIVSNHTWMLATRLARIHCLSHERGLNDGLPGMTRRLAPGLDAIVCISDAVRRNLEGQGIPSDNMVVILNALDSDRAQPTETPDQTRQRLNVAPSRRIIGLVGNIREWKGQDVVVRALPAVAARVPDVTCIFVGEATPGDREFAERLRALADELGVAEQVVFAGYQKEPANCMAIFEVVIHASTLPEPFGRVLLEAMALEKPVVASADGAVPEIVLDGQTGYLFPPGDSATMADRISDLLQSPDRARAFGRAGRARLDQEFRMETNVSAAVGLYEKLLTPRT